MTTAISKENIQDTKNPILDYQYIQNGLVQILKKDGVTDSDARCTAEILLEGTIRGYYKHGIERIFQIREGLKNRTIKTKPSRVITKDGMGFAIINADSGLGQPAGVEAINLAVKKAKMVGVGFCGVINAGHIGILSYYSELAAKNNCLGLVLSTTSPAVVVPGGRKAVLGTNPISFSFPNGAFPVTGDFSTAALSRGEVIACRDAGKKIPVGVAVNNLGKSTTDPNEALTGGILPYGGGVKGALLSLLFSTMAGTMIGAASNIKVTGTRYMNQPVSKGDLFICFDISQITDLGMFIEENQEFFCELKKTSEEFYIPGEGSQIRKKNNCDKNIPCSEKLQNLLATLS